MRAHAVLTLLCACAAIALVRACEPGQAHSGCKIFGASCSCGYGCKTEYIYRTKEACMNALRERSSNICSRSPCVRGICTQTAQDPGFACKCEGTGFYGHRCEKGNGNPCCRFTGSLSWLNVNKYT